MSFWLAESSSLVLLLAALSPLLSLFLSLIQRSQSFSVPLTITVHYTRAPTGKFPYSELFYPGLKLSPGRSSLQSALDDALFQTTSSVAKDIMLNTGTLIGVCGPAGLADDLSKAVGFVEPSRRDQVGGIELHEE